MDMKYKTLFFPFCALYLFAASIAFAEQRGIMPTARSSQTAVQRDTPQRAQAAGANKEKQLLRVDRQPGQIDRVKVQLKVGGEVIDVADKKERREKLSVDCDLDYEEKTLQSPADVQNLAASLRYYNRAEANAQIGDHAFKPTLPPDRSLIGVQVSTQRPVLFSPNACLTRKELELIDIQVNSLLLDRLLPEGPVAAGETWQPSEELMGQLLGLDEVGQSDVQCEVTEITNQVARFEMKGSVSGAVEGITASIGLRARYRYDLARKRVDWLGMAIKERRQVSPVNDGFEVAAQLQLLVVPDQESKRFDESESKNLVLHPTPQSLQLSFTSKEGDWRIAYDRNWYVIRDQKGQAAAVLKWLERGDLIAQCNISALARENPDKLVSLEKFQEDIKYALGQNFKEFVEASQSVDKANRRVLRVSVRGEASDLPILWNYYHVADLQGHQASFVFTFEEKYAPRLGKADLELMDSLRFIENSGSNP
jgi:hypothetical protein